MRLIVRYSVPVLVGAMALTGCGSRSALSVESVREAVGDDSSAITELRVNGSVVLIKTKLLPDQAGASQGLAMCQAIHETSTKPIVHVFGELQPNLPILLARTAEGDKPGDCRQGDLIGDPRISG
ncbi:hypothetical protein [Streptomyces sp. NPDC003863]